MPYYSKEEIARARSIDLLTYLQTYEPTELVHVRGDTFTTLTHDSLKISNGKWMWWSRGIGGASALDYLIKVRGMEFMDAMQILTDGRGAEAPSFVDRNQPNKKAAEKQLILPERSETNLEVIRYLTSRGIDRDIIRDCINEGLLYESLPYHSCVFVGMDEAGREAYACYRATNASRFMGEASGSDKRYAFRVEAAGDKIHCFESAIDLLSYATIMKMRTGKWRAEPMVSLGGVYSHGAGGSKARLPAALTNALERQPDIRTIALHLDNDEVGRAATEAIAGQLQDRYKVLDEPPPKGKGIGKDCNDYLRYLRQRERSRAMAERDRDGR